MNKPLIFGSGKSSFKDEDGLMTVCETTIDNGIVYFDTAPSYRTEEVLTRCLLRILRNRKLERESLILQTKIDPIQMYEGDIANYFSSHLLKLGLEYIDVLLIHWPVHNYFMKTWEAMNQLKEKGLTKRIGICNLRISHLEELKNIGVIPEVLQIERHPLNTFQNEMDFCRLNNIELQDYSPLCKMHPILRDSALLKQMSKKYEKSIGSIILRWHIDTGATPIFTSKKCERIEEYSQVDNFKLSKEDIYAINSLNINHKLYLESLICPGY